MSPLDAMDVGIRSFNATVLMLIILLNIRERAHPTSPLSAYLWREHPFLTELGLAFLGLVVAMSIIDLGVHFELFPAWSAVVALPLLGLPMGCLSVVILVLGTRAVYRGWREFNASRAGGSDAQRG